MHLHSSTGNSMTLSWAPPERPNGIILDYEIKYFEKVRQSPASSPTSTCCLWALLEEGLCVQVCWGREQGTGSMRL